VSASNAGLSPTDTWSRGQAWALYGFGSVYRATHDPRILDAAQRTADWFVSHLPPETVPRYAFGAPPGSPHDSSAAAIAASGLLQLARLAHGPERAQSYRAAALRLLAALSQPTYLDTTGRSASALLHGSYDVPGAIGVDSGLAWGDYFFLEALLRLRAAQQAAAHARNGDEGAQAVSIRRGHRGRAAGHRDHHAEGVGGHGD
jgi:unsaturated chondroitin disaccharide hydrolase